MSNLIVNAEGTSLTGWTYENVSILDGAFKIADGKMLQVISNVDSKSKSEKYKLSFNCLDVFKNSFILINLSSNLEDKTFMCPVIYEGIQEIMIESGKIDSFKFTVAGDLVIRDIVLESYFEGLTEEEKNALIKVENESEEWNKIKEITDDVGNVIAQKLKGAMHLNLVNIQNSTGQFTQNDNSMMWVSTDGSFASLWNDTGIYFANSKDGVGAWIWQNAIGANGVVATKVVAGAIDGQKIQGAEIVAGTLTGGTIKGAVFDGGTTQAGTIKGSTIQGSTIKSGENTGINAIMSPNEPFTFYNTSNFKKLSYDVSDDGVGVDMNFYRGLQANESPRMTLYGGGTFSGITINYGRFAIDNAGERTDITGRGILSLRTMPYYDGQNTSNAQNEWLLISKISGNGYCVLGNNYGETYIDGLVSAYNLQSRVLSESDVKIMELEEQVKTLQAQLTDLEVRLIERGVL